MEFSTLARRVVDCYLHGAYQEALQVVRLGRDRLPEEDPALTWYEACLLGVSGEPGRSLEVLEAGLDRGLAWHPRQLADADLHSVRKLEGWERFEQRSAERVEAWTMAPPPPMVRDVADPAGTLIALHGAGNHPERFFDEWDNATPREWALMVPVGDVPMTKDEWAWPFDLVTDSLVDSLAGLILTPRVVLAGFSQGGRLAAKAAWDGDVEATGLITVAAGLSTELWANSQQRSVPTYVLIGTADGGYDDCQEAASLLRKANVPVHLEVREGLGHITPPDLDVVIASALDWILSASQGEID